MQRLLRASVSPLLWLSLGCGEAGDGETFADVPGPAPYQPESSQPQGTFARGSACTFYPCFDACGQRIAVAAVEAPFGFVEAGSVPAPVRPGTPLDGGRVLLVDRHAVEIRSTDDLSVLGRAAVPGAIAAAAVGADALVQANSGALAQVDVGSGQPRMSGWWFDASSSGPRLRLLGAAGRRFLLGVGDGVSLVELASSGPRESACLEPPAGASWSYTDLIGDVLAIAEGPLDEENTHARLFRIADGVATEIGSPLPTEDDVPFSGFGDRLSVTTNNRRRLVVLDTSGAEPVEASSADGWFLPADEEPLAGFQFYRSGDAVTALDLRGALEPYDVSPVEAAPCLLRLSPQSGGAAVIVSRLSPAERLAPDPLPAVTCPTASNTEWAAAALSPDSARLLLSTRDGSVLREVTSGAATALDIPIAGRAFWVGERWVFAQTEGTDYGVTVHSQLAVRSASAPYSHVATIESPGPFIALRQTASDVWALSHAGDYEYGAAPPGERLLLRLDPRQGTPELSVVSALPGEAAALAASGDRAYVAIGARLAVFGRDGAALAELSLPSVPTSSAASELGYFMTDSDRLWWLPEGSDELTLLSADCRLCFVRTADARFVYATAHAPSEANHPHFGGLDGELGHLELRAYAPGVDTVLAGRHPIQAPDGDVLVGGERLFSVGGALSTLTVLSVPPAP